MENRQKLYRMTITALFAAAIAVMTAYLLHIPIPGGYVHIGDSLIYLAASLLPLPYAVAAAAIGAGLAAWVMLGDADAFLPQFVGTLAQAAGSGVVFGIFALAWTAQSSRPGWLRKHKFLPGNRAENPGLLRLFRRISLQIY